MSAPDFVAIGHVTLDRVGESTRPGGAALFAAVAAHRLGLSVGLLTSHGDDFPLDLIPPKIEVVSVPSADTSRFEHRLDASGRVSHVRAVAGPLTPDDVPDDWREAALALLAPVLDEVDPMIATLFTDGAVGAAAQGWLRHTRSDGLVVPRPWRSPERLLHSVQAFFLSREDIRGQEAEVVEWFQRMPVGVLTADREGALLFVNGERYEVHPRPAREVDPTGAGDVFAATFLVQYQREGDPWQAAAAAACAGSLAVEGDGWSAVADRAALDAALADYQSSR
ncbi:MAG TPA: PfkB family carbohydrate kinase [Candidatus Binatia bacterium]|nr:PfkB family carbohydrate kinase [Candidatus Binatia bacterium]